MNSIITLKNILIASLAVILITMSVYIFLAEKTYTSILPINPIDINAAKPVLKITDTVVGTGEALKPAQQAVFHYIGRLENGTEFDNSYTKSGALTTRIGVGDVIKGWDEGLIGMKVGGKRNLFIPSNKAYGEKAVGIIPAKANLLFEVELLKINP